MKNLLLTLLLLWQSLPTFASTIGLIKQISATSDQNQSVIKVELDRELDLSKIKVEEHGSFLQIILPETQVLEPGRFLDGNSPYVRKMAAFQIDDSHTGLRLFVSRNADQVKPAVTTEVSGIYLFIYINHIKVEKWKDFEVEEVTGVPTAEEVIQKTEVRQDTADPAQKVQETDENGFTLSSLTSDKTLQDKLTVITIFFSIFLLGLILLLKFRRILSRQGLIRKDPATLTMKTLASYPLAPKQRLTLVEVGTQKILLGVSPDNINFLTSIHENDNEIRSSQTLEPINRRVSDGVTKSKIDEKLSDRSRIDPSLGHAGVSRYRSSNQASGISNQLPEKFGEKKVTSHQNQAQPASTKVNSPRQQIPSKQSSDYQAEPKSIEDVTNLIRRKLKDLPKI